MSPHFRSFSPPYVEPKLLLLGPAELLASVGPLGQKKESYILQPGARLPWGQVDTTDLACLIWFTLLHLTKNYSWVSFMSSLPITYNLLII